MSNLINKASKIIKDNIYGTIGTSDKYNNPWVTPLFLAYDSKLSFYFVSPKDSKHAKNIRFNSSTSLVLFNSNAPKWTGVGVYMQGKTVELNNEKDIVKALQCEFKRLDEKIPNFKDYTGENAYRAYKFKPLNIWITYESEDKNGNSVDGRKELNLHNLISEL